LNATRHDEDGASLVEYILVAVLIGLMAVAGLLFLGKFADTWLKGIGAKTARQPS
jgi:Flp pilus assembly pilin Flp